MRRAPEQDVLGDRHPRRRRGLLRHDRDEPRELAAADLLEGPAVEPDLARERHETRECTKQGRLPRAVRPDERDPLALRDVRVDAIDDRASAQLDRDAAQFERAHAEPPRVVRRTSAKNGAPKKAVTTPSGISAGESAVRATTSASTRKPAPTITDNGRRAR